MASLLPLCSNWGTTCPSFPWLLTGKWHPLLVTISMPPSWVEHLAGTKPSYPLRKIYPMTVYPLSTSGKKTHTKTWSDLTCFFFHGSGGYSFSVWDLYTFFTCCSVGGVKLPGASSYKSPTRFPWIPSLSFFEFTVQFFDGWKNVKTTYPKWWFSGDSP